MTKPAIVAAAASGSLSPVALASVLDQSVDCVKLIGLDGTVQYMNSNGLCAMEIDDFSMIHGRSWADLWPDDARQTIHDSLNASDAGGTTRFRAFCPTAKGAPRWWDVTVSPIADADGNHAGHLSISRDVTDNHAAREALEIATAEMKHRLKNTYTMINSLLTSFARGDAGREAYAAEMSERLIALSAAQALFVSNEASCDIGVLVTALLAPFGNPDCTVAITGREAVRVDQGQADAIALVIGELAVNASKHGALAHGGSIQADWDLDWDNLTLLWVEHSKKPVAANARDGGQGLKLMERIMRARRGAIDFSWRENGVSVSLTLHLG